MTKNCSECRVDFDDEHGHGICFGCKIQGLNFGPTPDPNEPSRFAIENDWVANARQQGHNIERVTDSGTDKRLKKKKTVEHKHVSRSDVEIT